MSSIKKINKGFQQWNAPSKNCRFINQSVRWPGKPENVNFATQNEEEKKNKFIASNYAIYLKKTYIKNHVCISCTIFFKVGSDNEFYPLLHKNQDVVTHFIGHCPHIRRPMLTSENKTTDFDEAGSRFEPYRTKQSSGFFGTMKRKRFQVGQSSVGWGRSSESIRLFHLCVSVLRLFVDARGSHSCSRSHSEMLTIYPFFSIYKLNLWRASNILATTRDHGLTFPDYERFIWL